MKDIKFAKYAVYRKLGITKDGHAMFREDIAHDLNRKSHLEQVTLEQQQEINELKAAVNGLRESLGEIQCLPSAREDEGSSIAFRARKKSGAQWMASAYANEIERALDVSLTQVRHSSSLRHADTQRLYFIKEHANNLRGTNK